MEKTLNIRPLTKSDESDWRRLWTDYLTFYETSVTEAIYQTTFKRLLCDDVHEFNGLLAVRENTPVGLVHFLSHRHCWQQENVVFLQDLFVDPSERKKGTGRALIEAVYNIADTNETKAVYWHTHKDNSAAQLLYDRLATKTDFIKYRR